MQFQRTQNRESTLNLWIALIALDAVVFGYDRLNYTTMEYILHIGSTTATAERRHPVSLPPIFGWLPVNSGARELAFAAL